MLRQIVAFALRERDGLHGGSVGLHQLHGETKITQPLIVALRVDAHHTKPVGSTIVLHATEPESRLQTLVGPFQRVGLGVAHAGGIERAKGGVALLQKTVVELGSHCIVSIQQPRLGLSTVDKDIR